MKFSKEGNYFIFSKVTTLKSPFLSYIGLETLILHIFALLQSKMTCWRHLISCTHSAVRVELVSTPELNFGVKSFQVLTPECSIPIQQLFNTDPLWCWISVDTGNTNTNSTTIQPRAYFVLNRCWHRGVSNQGWIGVNTFYTYYLICIFAPDF